MYLPENLQAHQRYWRDYFVPTDDISDYWIYPEIAALGLGLREHIFLQQANDGTYEALARLCPAHGLAFTPALMEDGPAAIVHRRGKKAEPLLKALASEQVDSWLVGRLLGYPDCCVRTFLATDLGGLPDMVHLHRRSVPPFNHLLNNTCGLYKLISHFPCSYSCEKSARLAGRILAELRKAHGAAAAGIVSSLLKVKACRYRDACFQFEAFGKPFMVKSPLKEQFGLGEGATLAVDRRGLTTRCGGRSVRTTDGVCVFDFL